MVSSLLLGQVAAQGRFVLNSSQNISDSVRQSWDYAWDQALSGSLFINMVDVGIFLAAGSLAFWCVSFARKWLEDEASPNALQELVWPLIVILLLAHQGTNLALLAKGMRGLVNDVNANLLAGISRDIKVEDMMAELADFSSAEIQFASLRSQCNAIVNRQKQLECIQLQAEAMTGILSQYKQQHTDTPYGKKLAQEQALAKQDPDSNLVSGAANYVAGLAISPLTALVLALLNTFQWAFSQLVEVSMLLTALMGPIAIGTSLLPMGTKPIFAWLSAFSAVGILKLSYNLVVGLATISFYHSGNINNLAAALFFGLCAPILALGMAAGGGMALFSGLSGAVSGAVGLAVTQGVPFIRSNAGVNLPSVSSTPD